MATGDGTIEINGLALAFEAEAIGALIQKTGRPIGVEVRLAGLDVRLSQDAVNALLAALVPAEDQATAPRVAFSPGSVAFEAERAGATLRASVPLGPLSLVVAEGELRIQGG